MIMKTFTRFTIHVSSIFLVALTLWPSTCLADLSVTVRPGYTFGANERPTTSTLNRLGNPTILITGTVGGTNAGIAAGSINGTHFSDTVVDGTNITYNSASPRALTITASGVDVTQISTNIAGLGIAGGGGTNLYLNLEATNGLAITGDKLSITNLPPSRINLTSNYVIVGVSNNIGSAVSLPVFAAMVATNPAVPGFTSFEYSITASGNLVNTNHGLGVTPGMVRWVLVCKTADGTFAVGDEIEVQNLMNDITNPSFLQYPVFTLGANSTNVWASTVDTVTVLTVNKDQSTTPGYVALTESRWRLKCYARP